MATVTVHGAATDIVPVLLNGASTILSVTNVKAALNYAAVVNGAFDAGTLTAFDSSSTDTPATPPGGNVAEVELTSVPGGTYSLPAGYSYLVDGLAAPVSISGGSTAVSVLAGSGGLTFTGGTGGGEVISGGGNGLYTSAATGGGAYQIYLGDGNDTVNISSGSNIIDAGGGKNVVNALGSGTNFILSLTGAGDSITGGAGETAAILDDKGNTVTGGTGTLIVDDIAGGSTVSGSGARTEIFAGTGSTYTLGGAGTKNELIEGAAGPNTVTAGAGATTIFGGATSVINTGAGGVFFISATGAAQTITGGIGADTLFGASGASISLTSTSDSNLLIAGTGNETLNGASASGANALYAGTVSGAATSIIGGAGADTLFGGGGKATLTGGAGPTVFDFIQGEAGQSTVTNFNVAKDLIALSGADSASTVITSAGGSTTITLTDHTKITFTGVSSISNSTIHYG